MAVSDRARDLWDRISPRERVLVVLLVVAVPITLAIWLGSSMTAGLGKMETRNERMRKALIVLADLRARGPVQPEDNVLANIPVSPLSLETYLDNAAKNAGFTLKGTQPHQPVTRDGFVTSSVRISVDTLELDKLKSFLQEIETKSNYVAITKLDIKRNFRDKTKVDATLEVSTYSKEATANPDAEVENPPAKKGG
jgi:hypothetical protein